MIRGEFSAGRTPTPVPPDPEICGMFLSLLQVRAGYRADVSAGGRLASFTGGKEFIFFVADFFARQPMT